MGARLYTVRAAEDADVVRTICAGETDGYSDPVAQARFKTYRIGNRLSGGDDRFEVTEDRSGGLVEVYDRDGDFPCEVLPPDTPFWPPCRFRTVWGEVYRLSNDTLVSDRSRRALFREETTRFEAQVFIR